MGNILNELNDFLYRNLREITFRLTNVIPERIIFVSRGITIHFVGIIVGDWVGRVGCFAKRHKFVMEFHKIVIFLGKLT